MIQMNQLKLRPGHTMEDIRRKAAKMAGVKPEALQEFQIIKKSIDARKKPEVFFSYSVQFSVPEEKELLRKKKNSHITFCEKKEYHFPSPGMENMSERPVIIGMGPAGLFCGYFLAKFGYKPILLERGKDVESRTKDVEAFWKDGILNTASNVQFGEGGAGTFSDGKLNTLVKDKDGKNREVLKVFVECGAPENILYDGRPHIGTDVLRNVVKTMRERILSWGGEVRFENQITELIMEKNRLTGLVINEKEHLRTSLAVLAIGHSARDTFQMLYEKEIPMEAKSFAVGFRVQHPQKMIDYDQYGEQKPGLLPTASYKLVMPAGNQRSMYSFCMCPGGYVVNASSEEGRLAVNGMSYADRSGENANSAMILSVTPQDFGDDHPLSGIAFQRKLEERAYKAGNGQIPSQYYGEFKASVLGVKPEAFEKEVRPQMCGKTQFTDLTSILPEELNKAFVEGMEHFGRVLPGFNRPDALLSGVESRTSSPVRIIRGENLQSSLVGLYPCGEGAGYAGGITSAAMDGLRIAEKIASFYKPLDEKRKV